MKSKLIIQLIIWGSRICSCNWYI